MTTDATAPANATTTGIIVARRVFSRAGFGPTRTYDGAGGGSSEDAGECSGERPWTTPIWIDVQSLRPVSVFCVKINQIVRSDLLCMCRPEATENVEEGTAGAHPASGRSEHYDTQGAEQVSSSAPPTTGGPSIAVPCTQLMLVGASGASHRSSEVPVVEEPEVEEIERPDGEPVLPQRIRVCRKRGYEWVFHEEENSDRALRKLRKTVKDLMEHIHVIL